MIKICTLAALVAALAANSTAFARDLGTSYNAPGQKFHRQARGSVGGPGASGYAPGRQYVTSGHRSIHHEPGASGYAPSRQ